MAGRTSQTSQAAAIARVVDACAQGSDYREHLKDLLDSPVFRVSRRSQEFLTYVVEKSLSGHFEDMKERSIGVELFGRSASYDTGADAIVRVTASDVRRRLHQYYAETASELRIELPSGSYIPEFRHRQAAVHPPAVVEAADPAPTPSSTTETDSISAHAEQKFPRRKFYVAAGIVLAGVALLSAGWTLGRSGRSEIVHLTSTLPWSSLFHSNRDLRVVLCDPDISMAQQFFGYYITVSDYANQRYYPQTPARNPEALAFVRAHRGVNVAAVDSAIVLAVGRLSGPSRRIRTHTARSMHILDFKSDDSFVLLGSPRSNPWFNLYQEQLGFRFERDPASGQEIIRNHSVGSGESSLYVPTAKGWDTGHAYAIVALIRNGTQQGNVLLIAGSNAEATEAAGEFVTHPEFISQSLMQRGIDPRKPNQSFEVLLRVGTMAGSPGKFEVVALHPIRER